MEETKREGRGNKDSEIWNKLSFLWVITYSIYSMVRDSLFKFHSVTFHNMWHQKHRNVEKDIGKENYLSIVLHSIAV